MAGKHSIGESTLQNGSWGRAPNGGLLVSRITGHVESGIGVCPVSALIRHVNCF
jgi:hypothetical protein